MTNEAKAGQKRFGQKKSALSVLFATLTLCTKLVLLMAKRDSYRIDVMSQTSIVAMSFRLFVRKAFYTNIHTAKFTLRLSL